MSPSAVGCGYFICNRGLSELWHDFPLAFLGDARKVILVPSLPGSPCSAACQLGTGSTHRPWWSVCWARGKRADAAAQAISVPPLLRELCIGKKSVSHPNMGQPVPEPQVRKSSLPAGCQPGIFQQQEITWKIRSRTESCCLTFIALCVLQPKDHRENPAPREVGLFPGGLRAHRVGRASLSDGGPPTLASTSLTQLAGRKVVLYTSQLAGTWLET